MRKRKTIYVKAVSSKSYRCPVLVTENKSRREMLMEKWSNIKWE